MKRQPMEWEKIFTNCMSDKELTQMTYKEIMQVLSREPNNLIKIWTRDLDRIVFRKDLQMANRYDKVLSITNCKGNAK